MRVNKSAFSVLAIVGIGLFVTGGLRAQAIVFFDPDGGGLTSTADAIAGLTIGTLTAGSGLDMEIETSGQAHYEVTGWATDDTFDVDQALSFTITNNTGSALNINGVSFLYKVNNKGPDSGQLRYKVDDGAVQEFAGIGSIVQFDHETNYPNDFNSFDSVGLSALADGAELTIYLAGYNASSSGQTAAQLANIRVFSVEYGGGPAVPEPATAAALLGLGAMGIAATRRRRPA